MKSSRNVRVVARYPGPNIFAPIPAIRFSLKKLKTGTSQSRIDELATVLPNYRNANYCGTPVTDLWESSADTNALGHLFEYLCIELQNLAGAEL